MLDQRELVRNKEIAVAKLGLRNVPREEVEDTIDLLRQRNTLRTATDELIATSRKCREAFVQQQGTTGVHNLFITPIPAELNKFKQQIDFSEASHRSVAELAHAKLIGLPNFPDEDTAKTPSSRIVREVTGRERSCNLRIPHWTLAEHLGIGNSSAALKISGPGYMVLTGDGARLIRALESFALEQLGDKYREVCFPHLMNDAALYGSGHLPKFAAGAYKIEGEPIWAIPTAEVPLVGLHRDEKIKLEALPLCYMTNMHCFRKEIGGGGKDSRWRLHEYHQVELMRICTPSQAEENYTELVNDTVACLGLLGVPYRLIKLCPADLPFSAARAYRLDAYSYGSDTWLPISMASLFYDFQARRSNIKYQGKTEGGFVTTMNSSALAVSRLWGILLEQGVEADGRVQIPHVLRPFMGKDFIQTYK